MHVEILLPVPHNDTMSQTPFVPLKETVSSWYTSPSINSQLGQGAAEGRTAFQFSCMGETDYSTVKPQILEMCSSVLLPRLGTCPLLLLH